MAEYEVEVVGHFSATVNVEADSYEEAEEIATRQFNQDYKPYSVNDGWTDSWHDTNIECVINLEGEEE